MVTPRTHLPLRGRLCPPAPAADQPRIGAGGPRSPPAEMGGERLAAGETMALRARVPRRAAMGRASPKARQAVAEECGASATAALICRQVSSSDEHGPPTALLDHRKHASDEGEGARAHGRVDLGDGSRLGGTDFPTVVVGDRERF